MKYLVCLDPQVKESPNVLHAQSLLTSKDEVVLLTVYTEPDRLISAGLLDDGLVATLPPEVYKDRADALRAAANSVMTHYAPLFPGATTRIVESRDVRGTILKVAEDEKVDIIILAARSQSAVARVLLGSTSTHILHQFPHAVKGCMVVHQHSDPKQPQTFAVAYDGTPAAKGAVAVAASIISPDRGDKLVVVVALVPPPESYLDFSPFAELPTPNPHYAEELKVCRTRADAMAAAGVRLAVEAGAPEGSVGSEVVTTRDPRDGLTEYGNDASKKIGTFVVGSRGLGAVSRFLLGSVSSHLATHITRAAVLVVHPTDGGRCG